MAFTIALTLLNVVMLAMKRVSKRALLPKRVLLRVISGSPASEFLARFKKLDHKSRG